MARFRRSFGRFYSGFRRRFSGFRARYRRRRRRRSYSRKPNYIKWLIGLLILGGAGFFAWKKFLKKK